MCNKDLIRNLIYIYIITILGLDISGDYLIRDNILNYEYINSTIRLIVVISTFILILISITQYNYSINGVTIIPILIYYIYMYGLIIGIINGNFANSLREFIVISPLLIIPILSDNKINIINILKKSMLIIIIIAAIKVIVTEIISLYVYDSISWKIMLRSTPVLIFPCLFYLHDYLLTKNKLSLVYFSLTIIIILIAQARIINAILFFGIFILLVRYSKFLSIKKIAIITFIIFTIGLLCVSITNLQLINLFGIWSGPNFESSVGYRFEQLIVLMERLELRWLTGYGLGYYNDDYGVYHLMNNQYLLELDLFNLFTKFGLPFSVIYMSTYYYIYIKVIENNSEFIFIFFLGIILLLINSIFQTMHSSFVFWVLYSYLIGMLNNNE